eukprot:CAMPEP_0117070112 /NCGR_PEP_ID=MMETSP0472-20121206/49270_1 /TAXON_ID=693140 ORGANISM="Tiarina fusus, Strain LIS" /NCGR_SAMPLE_ID=MMETSP0472 /ASSEMBLY_ACC=CAM_ASM_000603 /LENGTH=109 /DNA_ID=CAMNT_0004793111 /DNA_START=42 /DNA_END=368 /DNA_ORIENTATION=+
MLELLFEKEYGISIEEVDKLMEMRYPKNEPIDLSIISSDDEDQSDENSEDFETHEERNGAVDEDDEESGSDADQELCENCHGEDPSCQVCWGDVTLEKDSAAVLGKRKR